MSETAENTPAPITIDIAAMVPGIVAKTAQAMAERAQQQIGYSLQNAIDAAVKTHIDEHVLPEVRAELVRQHPVIVAAMVAGVQASVTKIGEGLVEHATKKMSGYDGEKFIAELFSVIAKTRHY